MLEKYIMPEHMNSVSRQSLAKSESVEAIQTEGKTTDEKGTEIRSGKMAAEERQGIAQVRQELGLVVNPKDLLLTPEQEARVKREDAYFVCAKADEQEIRVAGMRHTNDIKKMQIMVREFKELYPDVVFVEGQSLEKIFPKKPFEEITESEAAAREEQVYMAWLARKHGKEVQNWDLTVEKQLRGVLERQTENGRKYELNDVRAWVVLYGLRKVYEMRMRPSQESLEQVVSMGLPGLENLGIDMRDKKKIDEVLEQSDMPSLEKLEERYDNEELRVKDQKEVTRLSNPQVNRVAREMNILRDRHAIDVLQKAKQVGFKKVFVSAGISHAITWEQAIKEIYKGKKTD